MKLQRSILTFIVCATAMGTAIAQSSKPPSTRGPATMKELMALVVDPASAGIFKVASEAPKTDADWKTLQGQALTLLEIANTLTTPARAKDKAEWMKHAKDLQAQSKIAFAAAMAKDAKTLANLNDPLYTACANCHEKYQPKR